jgi:hypothetical protein
MHPAQGPTDFVQAQVDPAQGQYAYVQIGSQCCLASELLTYLRKACLKRFILDCEQLARLVGALQGSQLTKHGRQGAPKQRLFKLSPDNLELQWTDKKGKVLAHT